MQNIFPNPSTHVYSPNVSHKDISTLTNILPKVTRYFFKEHVSAKQHIAVLCNHTSAAGRFSIGDCGMSQVTNAYSTF